VLADATGPAVAPGKLAMDPIAGAVTTVSSLAGPVGAPVANGRAGDAAAAAPAPLPVYPQIAPALVSLAGGPPGTQRLTLRLDPAELGHVQIRIDRPRDAPAEVSITVERPETLALLQRDRHELHRALDQAGIQAEGRQVFFHNAAPSSDGAGHSPLGQSPADQSFGFGSDARPENGQAGQDSARGRVPRMNAGGSVADGTAAAPGGPGWLRAGLDITA
jgi:flagellar hook-length control protein FliK